MCDNLPDFFANRHEPRNFEDVLVFIREHFEVTGSYGFRVGKRVNDNIENQRALIVFVYAHMMDYTFNQVKALFAEHDHFAIALPETRQGRNILEFNKIFATLLQQGHAYDSKINDFPDFFDFPKGVLVVKM